jgi:hypothetical protein
MDMIHRAFDNRDAAILKVCHIRPPTFPYLILLHFHRYSDSKSYPRHQQAHIPSTVKYPVHARYTLQWLINPGLATIAVVPNNIDAAFKRLQEAETLRSITYGAAIGGVMGWNSSRTAPPSSSIRACAHNCA